LLVASAVQSVHVLPQALSEVFARHDPPLQQSPATQSPCKAPVQVAGHAALAPVQVSPEPQAVLVSLFEQVPSLPARLHASHSAPHAALQQYPSTH